MTQYTITAWQNDQGKWQVSGTMHEPDGDKMKVSEYDLPPDMAYATQQEAEDAARAYFKEQGYSEKNS